MNISPDHIDRHGSLDGYVAAKTRICQASTHQNVIIGVDDPKSLQLDEALKDSPPHHTGQETVSCKSALEAGIFDQDGKLDDTYWEDGRSFFDLTQHLSLQGQRTKCSLFGRGAITQSSFRRFDFADFVVEDLEEKSYPVPIV